MKKTKNKPKVSEKKIVPEAVSEDSVVEVAEPVAVEFGAVGGEFTRPDQIYTAVGMVRLGKATDSYVAFTLTIQNSSILEVSVSHPHLKTIAIEEAKIRFVKTVMTEEV